MSLSRLHFKIFGTFLFTLVAAELLAFAIFRSSFDRDRMGRFSGIAANHALLLNEAIQKRISEQLPEAKEVGAIGRALRPFLVDLSSAYGGRVWLVSEGITIADSGTGPQPNFPTSRARDFERYSVAWERGGKLHVKLPISGSALKNAQLHFRAEREHDSSLDFIPVLVGLALAFVILSIPISRWITRRVHRLRDTAISFAAGNLSERAPEEGRDEISQLAQAFNVMAERIERMIAAQKDLSAHVSHELRSPLARMRLAEELLRGEPHLQNATGLDRLDSIRAEIELLDRLIGRIMAFSAMDTRHEEHQSVDAGACLNECVLEFQSLLAHRELSPELFLNGKKVMNAPAMLTTGSRDLLLTAFRAALENALRYSKSPGVVRIDMAQRGPAWVVAIENVSDRLPDDLEQIFEPFQRGGGGGDGHGLGLALARRALVRCGGSATARVQGNSFTLEFTMKARDPG